jgi:hypothetical protein
MDFENLFSAFNPLNERGVVFLNSFGTKQKQNISLIDLEKNQTQHQTQYQTQYQTQHQTQYQTQYQHPLTTEKDKDESQTQYKHPLTTEKNTDESPTEPPTEPQTQYQHPLTTEKDTDESPTEPQITTIEDNNKDKDKDKDKDESQIQTKFPNVAPAEEKQYNSTCKKDNSNTYSHKITINKLYPINVYDLPVEICESGKYNTTANITNVPKCDILIPNGIYYINNKGEKTYLTPFQRKQWKNGLNIAGRVL